MNTDHARTWFEVVLGGLPGWINLRAIDPDQQKPARSEMVRTVSTAVEWCERWDGHGYNLYAGLARRGEQLDDNGRIDASEKNLAGCRVVWADLDDGTHDEQAQRVREFPLVPTLLVNSGGGLHPIWQLEEPIECASDPESNARLRRILKGVQVVIGGDPAVVDPSRIFRVAGTTNYPNAGKRAKGRVVCASSIVEHSPYTVVLEDFDDFEARGEAEDLRVGKVHEVQDHGEVLPPSADLVLERVPHMRSVFFCETRLKNKTASEEDFAIASGIMKHAPWIADADIVAALRYRRRALAHLVKGSEKTASYFSTTVASARKRRLKDGKPPDYELSPARWFQWVLTRALRPQRKPIVEEAGEYRELPRISTSVDVLDERTGGGVYGLSVLAGDSGVGKSTVALNVALHAKAAGWDVVYVAAEMEQAEYEKRAARYLHTSEAELRDSGRMPMIAHVADGLDLDSLIDLLMMAPTNDTERYLIVFDSLTKISAYIDKSSATHSLFDSMNVLTRMGESAVRFGDKRIAVLMTSELNKDGAALGRRITYSASLQVNMMQDKEQPDLVKVSVAKGRHSAKTQPMGPFMQDWRNHRLNLIGDTAEERDEDERAIY